MTRRFEGTCFGGPLDGKWLAHSTPVYKVALNEPSVLSSGPLDFDPHATVKIIEYEIDCMFTDATGHKVFMWQVKDKKKTALEIIEKLLDSYSRLADLKR